MASWRIFLVDRLNFTPRLEGLSCDIKDPNGNITWTTPEGMTGPDYLDVWVKRHLFD